MTAFVAGSVVWKMKAAGMLVTVDMSQPVAVTSPALMIVAKPVAGVPTCTERLLGKSADTKLVNTIEVVLSRRERSLLEKFAVTKSSLPSS